MLRLVTPQALIEHENTVNRQNAEAQKPPDDSQKMTELASFIRGEWEMMRNHRNSATGWNNRLLHAMDVFNGRYDSAQLAEIRKFGGSEVYARVIAVKSRAATALLREVYLGNDRPWGLDPTPEPTLADNLMGDISQLVDLEARGAMEAGQPLDINAVRDRTNGLIAAARRAAIKKAKEEAKIAESKLDDILVEGGFYDALTEFLTDIPLFPFGCIKGPIVRMVPDVVWQDRKPVTQQRAKMFWERKSPFDIYWTPGVSSIKDAAVIERLRLTRADLNNVLGLPGYNEENVRAVLDEYGRGGLRDWMDSTDQERANAESRESPTYNRSGLLDCIEYHGNIQGRLLRDHGFSNEEIPDELRDYFVQVWLIGRYVIKCQISPNPRKRHPYHITSFEKVPGTPVGNALPDILADIQSVCNATLRQLVNNMGMASGPQVVVDDSRLSPLENGDEMYPWKRWRVRTDPLAPAGRSDKPIEFFQPNSHAQELLGVYKEFFGMADELSAIPRYMTGSGNMGGAGRTSSGLAMLMGNASKVLQMVSSNIDNDVMQGILEDLYDMVMLTDRSNTFRGDETVRVRGVEVAVQKETNRMRQIEFLTATANPIDTQIMGPDGRAKLLRAVSKTTGIEDDIVPSEEELKARMQGPPEGAVPVTPEGNGQPAPANTDPGVQEANAMRGMAGGTQSFSEGGLVSAPRVTEWEMVRDEGGKPLGMRAVKMET